MTSSVTPISVARRPGKPSAPSLKTVAGSAAREAQPAAALKVFADRLEKYGLSGDARAIWLGYPNLQDACELLFQLLSDQWPCRDDPQSSAAIDAAIAGVRQVREAMMRGESMTRDLIVATFFHHLGTVASDVVAFVAMAYSQDKPLDQFDSETATWASWVARPQVDEIRFYPAGKTSRRDLEGRRVKLICAIASARDLAATLQHFPRADD